MTDFRRDYEVDILIRGWGNTALTKKLLYSLIHQTDLSRVHITYVDNGSPRDDLTSLLLTYRGDYLTYVALPFNHGSVRAINVGLALAAMSPAPYVLLLDNDTHIPNGDLTWLDRWLSYFEDEQVGAAGAVSDYTSGWQNCESNPDVFQKDWEADGQAGTKEPPNLPILVSFAMMLRKAAIRQVGLFDEQFEPGNCEDYDYTLRLMDAGWKNIVANSVWIHHEGSQTFGPMGLMELVNKNMHKLVAKYGVAKLAEMGIQVNGAVQA